MSFYRINFLMLSKKKKYLNWNLVWLTWSF